MNAIQRNKIRAIIRIKPLEDYAMEDAMEVNIFTVVFKILSLFALLIYLLFLRGITYPFIWLKLKDPFDWIISDENITKERIHAIKRAKKFKKVRRWF